MLGDWATGRLGGGDVFSTLRSRREGVERRRDGLAERAIRRVERRFVGVSFAAASPRGGKGGRDAMVSRQADVYQAGCSAGSTIWPACICTNLSAMSK